MGFPLDLFEDGLDDSYLCWVCKQVLDNPLAVPCGHVFCSTCVEAWISKFNSCPCECQGHINASDLNQVQPLNSLIGKLTSKCWNHDKGCKFTGQLRDAKLHLSVCQFDSPAAETKSDEEIDSTEQGLSESFDALNAMKELRERARELEKEVSCLKLKLQDHKEDPSVGNLRNKQAEESLGKDSVVFDQTEFNIIQVSWHGL